MRRLVSIAAATAIVLTAGCASAEPAPTRAVAVGAPSSVTSAQITSVAAAASPVHSELPATFLAVRDGTRLVVVDTATGEDQRVLFELAPQTLDPGQTPQTIDGLDLSPDGTTAFFSVGPEPASGVLYRVALPGGQAEQIGYGWRPKVSPDGTKLAYLALQTVVIEDLVRGTSRRLEMDPEDEGVYDPAAVDWAPDSHHLVLEAQWADSLRVLDTRTAAHQADGPLLGSGPDHGEYWLAGVRADGLVGALVALYPPQSDDPQPARTFAVLDPTTGAEKGRLDLPFAAVDSVYDASGDHQLFVAEDGSLHRRSGGGFTRIPGSGASLVAW